MAAISLGPHLPARVLGWRLGAGLFAFSWLNAVSEEAERGGGAPMSAAAGGEGVGREDGGSCDNTKSD